MNPFAERPKTLDTGTLERMAEPKHRVLAAFIHNCSPDPATRTVATTALVTGLWQLAGRNMTNQLPSVILLNAAEAAADPVDTFTARLVVEQGDTGPRVHSEGAFMQGTPELAPKAMTNALRRRAQLGEPNHYNQGELLMLKIRYFDAMKSGFGSGRCRSYSKAWHEDFDLLTEPCNRLILRLDEAADRTAFRDHVLEDPDKLRAPVGYGVELQRCPKHIAVSGSLTPDLCDEQLTAGVVDLGLPLFFLPHLAREPLAALNLPALDYLTSLLSRAAWAPVDESASLPPIDWFELYGDHLRKRLRELPAAFEYSVQRTVRELSQVCHRLARLAGRESDAPPGEAVALYWDLHAQTLRGMVISVAALAWHCLGFDPGCPRSKALKALGDLRGKGPMSRSALLRAAHLTKAERDVLLERLVAEDLVRVDGRMVAATSHADFVAALYARKEFPEAENLWAVATGDGEASA